MSQPLDVPVVLMVFNRPETTTQVFARIREARPRHLFVIADGPRADHPTDKDRCEVVRKLIEIDWPCTLDLEYAVENLGLKRRVESGLNWVFAQVEEAIILEDDCLPEASFFPFCQEILARYRHEPAVMGIGGTNFWFGRHQIASSYTFSRYAQIWGWATWRRAWQHYDGTMAAWPRLRADGWLERIFEEPAAQRYWDLEFERNYQTHHSWAYAWKLSCWQSGGLCVVPERNMVRNMGFGDEATHTKNRESRFADLATQPMEWPLRHPPKIQRNQEADLLTEQNGYSGEHFVRPMFAAARRLIQAQRVRAK